MATKPINKYTVQEATNLRVYEDYKFTTITLNGTNAIEGTDWANNPAKEIVIFSKGAVADDDDVTVELKIAGSYGDDIVISHDNLPLTIKGLLIDRVKCTGGAGDDDVLSVLSFH